MKQSVPTHFSAVLVPTFRAELRVEMGRIHDIDHRAKRFPVWTPWKLFGRNSIRRSCG